MVVENVEALTADSEVALVPLLQHEAGDHDGAAAVAEDAATDAAVVAADEERELGLTLGALFAELVRHPVALEVVLAL